MTTTDVTAFPDLCVFIGRFSPLHKGHVLVIKEGLKRARHMIVLVGSANEPRTYRNPFTAEERAQMIRATFNNDPRLIVLPLEDSTYNLTDWIESAERTVLSAWDNLSGAQPEKRKPTIALIGHAKDATSYYLNLFPQWGSIGVPQEHVLCATQIRASLFGDVAMARDLLEELDAEAARAKALEITRGTNTASIKDIMDALTAAKAAPPSATSTVPTSVYLEKYLARAKVQALQYLQDQKSSFTSDLSIPVISFLENFISTPAFAQVAQEYAFVAKYRWAWRFAPHAPLFITADAVIIRSGHVLLIKRRSFPGKGLWALPGGFVEENESILDSCLRELDEETAIKLDKEALRQFLVSVKVFDEPFRSSRGRTVTHAHLFHLPPGPLPKTKTGGLADDGETMKICWVPLSQLDRSKFFEDHYSIIKNLTRNI